MSGDYSPTGAELVAAAEHAAAKAARYRALAGEWTDEACRLTELAMVEGGHRGLLARVAGVLGVSSSRLCQMRTDRRAA
jgi:hypothetical protein